MSRSEETPAVTRSEFLRLAALGAGGLGLTALAGCNTTKTIVEGSRPGRPPYCRIRPWTVMRAGLRHLATLHIVIMREGPTASEPWVR